MSKLYNATRLSKIIFIQDNMERLEHTELDDMIDIIVKNYNSSKDPNKPELLDNDFYKEDDGYK